MAQSAENWSSIPKDHLGQGRSQPDIWSYKCKFFCVYRPYKKSVAKEMSNDDDLNLHTWSRFDSRRSQAYLSHDLEGRGLLSFPAQILTRKCTNPAVPAAILLKS